MKSNNKISFLLPSPGRYPVGGFKIVYQYSNYLDELGYDVTIYFCPIFEPEYQLRVNVNLFKVLLHYFVKKYTKTYEYKPNWFKFNKNIKLRYIPFIRDRFISNSDYIIFSCYGVANIGKYLSNEKGKKLFMIQEYEGWMKADKDMKLNYKRIFNEKNIENIAISVPVKRILTECNAKISLYLPNFIDFKQFDIDIKINSKKRTSIGFPTRNESHKGMREAVEVLKIIKKTYKDIDIWSFGLNKPEYFPEWIKFYNTPSNGKLRVLYNTSKIFMLTSYYEGWGLPGTEAMACGCALVSTRNGGVDSYAVEWESVLLSDIKDVDSMANNITKLLNDNKLRIRIAKNGSRYVKQFSADNSTEILSNYLQNLKDKFAF